MSATGSSGVIASQAVLEQFSGAFALAVAELIFTNSFSLPPGLHCQKSARQAFVPVLLVVALAVHVGLQSAWAIRFPE